MPKSLRAFFYLLVFLWLFFWFIFVPLYAPLAGHDPAKNPRLSNCIAKVSIQHHIQTLEKQLAQNPDAEKQKSLAGLKDDLRWLEQSCPAIPEKSETSGPK